MYVKFDNPEYTRPSSRQQAEYILAEEKDKAAEVWRLSYNTMALRIWQKWKKSLRK